MTTTTDTYINAPLADATSAKNLFDGLSGDDIQPIYDDYISALLADAVDAALCAAGLTMRTGRSFVGGQHDRTLASYPPWTVCVGLRRCD